MKIIVAGDGKVGSTLIRQLSAEGYDLTLIDSNRRQLERSVERYDIMAVHGNCASMAVLEQAGAGQADLLIAATSADEVNLLCCVTAHELNPRLHTIARVRNPEYIDQVSEMRSVFALSMIVSPELQAAAEIERLLKYPGFLRRDTFAKGRTEIVELRVDSSSKLCNVKLTELDTVVKCKVLVCAALRGGKVVTPAGNFVILEGDRLFVTAPSDVLPVLLKNLGIITRKVKKVALCGGGRISYYLAESLAKSGIGVKLIEQQHERCEELAKALPNAEIVEGDASDQELLSSENVTNCDALVSLTGMDELNTMISLYAQSQGVPQIITKIDRIGGHILDNLAIGSIICPKDLCCTSIVRYVRAVKNQAGAATSIHSIADGYAEALEFQVDEHTRHCGVPLKQLRLKSNVLVVSITHGAATEIPGGDSCFQVGDTVVVVTSGGRVIYQMNDIFA